MNSRHEQFISEANTPEDVIKWMSDVNPTVFFESVKVLPFGNMAFVFPKDMDQNHAIKQLCRYMKIEIKSEQQKVK